MLQTGKEACKFRNFEISYLNWEGFLVAKLTPYYQPSFIVFGKLHLLYFLTPSLSLDAGRHPWGFYQSARWRRLASDYLRHWITRGHTDKLSLAVNGLSHELPLLRLVSKKITCSHNLFLEIANIKKVIVINSSFYIYSKRNVLKFSISFIFQTKIHILC